jgi:hypothetical protein
LILVAVSDNPRHGYSERVSVFAASIFVVSSTVLEFIFWEVYHGKTKRDILGPLLIFALYISLLSIRTPNSPYDNSQGGNTNTDTNSFYQLCHNVEDVVLIQHKLHSIVSVASITGLAALSAWVVERLHPELKFYLYLFVSPVGWERLRATLRLRQSLPVVVILLLLSSLAALLFTYVAYRRVVTVALGTENPETVWTLGQILTLASWLPFVLDFLLLVLLGR